MPADEGLPTFHIRPSADGDPFKSLISLSQHYRPAEPAYVKERSKHPDEYTVGFFDAYYPDILYAQVVAKPSISTPSLSADEVRRQRNGSGPSLPNITLPTEFMIQLYNPESQVIVRQKHSTWTGNYWEFTLPIKSFRQPTGSRLDAEAARSSAVPLSGVSTFRWRKDGGMVSRASLRCTLLSTANTSNGDANARKKGGAEPDITLAVMDRYREVSIYEQHFTRVDVEDMKGLELVLVLSASVIADIYHSPPATTFNVSPLSALSAQPKSPTAGSPTTLTKTPSLPSATATVVNPAVYAETARLQKEQVAYERRAQREQVAQTRRNSKAAEEEEKRIKRMLEDEARAEQQRIAAVEAETERLRKLYANEPQAWGRQPQWGASTQQVKSQQQRRQAQHRPVPQINFQSEPALGHQYSPSSRTNQQRPQSYTSPHSYGPPITVDTSVNTASLSPPAKTLGHTRKSSNILRVFGGSSKNTKTKTDTNGNTNGASSSLFVPGTEEDGAGGTLSKLVKKKKSSLW